MFYENTELIPSSDSYEISPVNNDPTEHITFSLVEIPVINQFEWVEVTSKD